MRNGKSFLVLLVLAAGLGYYAYFVEPTKETSREARAKREKLFTVEAEKIDELTVKAVNGDVTKLTKTGDTWKIVSPAALAVDPAEVSAITTALAGLEQEKVVEENPPSLKEFTLDPARISITFHSAGETGTHRLDVGVKTPLGENLYAKLEGKPAVFLIGSYREDALNKSTFSLRDKTVLTFDREGANFLKIDNGKAPIVIARTDKIWRLSTPIDAAADFTVVDGLVGRLYQSRMKAYVTDDGTKDLKKYGLDKPQYTVTIGAGSARSELAIGTKTEDGNVYARELTRPNIFALEGTLLDDLKREAGDYRQKDVFDFRAFTALTLNITYKGATYGFARQGDTGDGQNGTWKQTKPAAKDLDMSKAGTLLANLSSLRGETFVNALGAGEDVSITATFGLNASPKTETVTFRIIAKDKDGKPTVQAQRQGEKGALVLSALEFDKAMAIFKELTGAK